MNNERSRQTEEARAGKYCFRFLVRAGNVGQDASQDISDGSSLTPIAGSMHNIDEHVPYDSSRPHPYLYNVLGCFFSVLIGFGIPVFFGPARTYNK